MISSVYFDILTTVQFDIQNLNLRYGPNATPLAVNIRKLPDKEEQLDKVPLIVLAPSTKPEKIRQLSFEDASGIEATYFASVVLIFSGGRDLLTNLDLILSFRQKVRRLFQLPGNMPGVTQTLKSVFNFMVDPEYVLDRSMLSSMYDYSELGLWFQAVEPRLNP